MAAIEFKNTPISCGSCRRFVKLEDAEAHARTVSKLEKEPRHVIHTGDVYFSSTTAQVFWYERLVISYRNGLAERNYLTDEDVSI